MNFTSTSKWEEGATAGIESELQRQDKAWKDFKAMYPDASQKYLFADYSKTGRLQVAKPGYGKRLY